MGTTLGSGVINFFRSTGNILQIPEEKIRSVALWDVTRKCDLRCVHCYNYDKYLADTPATKQETTTAEALGIIDKLADFGFNQIHFLGGEPLNREDCLQLFAHATARGMAVSINSNGIRLSERMMEQLIDVGVYQLAISLDGSDAQSNDPIRGKGTFESLRRNLEAAVKINAQRQGKVQLGIVATLTAPLLKEPGKVQAYFPLLDSLGIYWINFIFLYKNSNALKEANHLAYPMGQALETLEREGVAGMRAYPKIYVQLDCRPTFGKYLNRKYGVFTHIYHWAIKCSAGQKTCLIEADGQVHPCGLCSSPDYGLRAAKAGCFVFDPMNLANVQEFKQVYNSEYFRTVRRYLHSKENYAKFMTCADCEYLGKVCLPCPIYSTDGAIHEMPVCRVEECEWTKQQLEAFYEQQDSTIPCLLADDMKIISENAESFRVCSPSLKASFKLSRTGAIIWPWINGHSTVSNLVERLANSFPNSPNRSQLRRDVVDFLCSLRDGRILVLKGV